MREACRFLLVAILLSAIATPTVARATPAPSVTAPTSLTSNAATFTLVSSSGTTVQISGFSAGDNVQVVITADTGTVKITTTSNLSAPTGYTSAQWTSGAASEIAFTGVPADLNNALATLSYKASANGNTPTLSIEAFIAGAAFNSANGHYYEVINYGSISPEEARCRAKYSNTNLSFSGITESTDTNTASILNNDRCTTTDASGLIRRTYQGLSGYLATVTSLEEHQFIREKTAATAWIGGSDADSEGTFVWMDGPEKGQVFWQSGKNSRTTNTFVGTDNSPVAGFKYGTAFNYFSDGEPNNSSNEDWAEFGFGSNGVGSSWNDCRNSCGRTRYIIEYGDTGDAKTSATASISVSTPPSAPTSLTSSALSATDVRVNFGVPASNGGSTITNYQYSSDNGSTWTSFSPATTTSPVTITALTGGTAYQIKLRAVNSVGNGTASSASSVTTYFGVNFNSNGGVGSMNLQSANSSTALTANSFTRTYFNFSGWNTSADGSGTPYANQATYAFASNATLYAQWSDTRKTQLISLSGDTLDKGQVITLSAYGYSGTGSISYSLQSGDCTLRSSVLTATSGSGTCQVSATIDADATYQSATTTATFTQRTRTSQTINFTALNPMTTTSLPQNLLATSTSGLVVSFASNTPAVCVVINGTVRTIGRGSCSVTASQAGSSTILPAPSVTQNFTVTGLPQTITFAEPNSMTTISEDQAISATSSVGLSVNLKSSTPSVCSVSSNAVVPIAAGVCIITASQPGDSTYEPALDVSRNITITYVAKSPQNIAISQLSAMIAGEPSQGLSVTSSTRTRLTITVNPASVCSLDSQKKIIPIAEGQCIVTAAQEETRQYLPAISSVTLSIFKSGVTAKRSVALQWIRPAAIDDKTALGVNQLNAKASAPGSFVYSPSIGTILPGGIHDLKVTFTPTDRSRFLPTTMTVKILVLRTQTPQSPSPSPSPSPTVSPENKVMLPQPITINFVSGSSKLTTFEQSSLRTYADILKRSGVTEVTVAGFTDNVGRENLKLSTARAKVVKEFLIRIFPTLKVNTQSFGSSNPVASNDSDAGKALNRRVTITPIK